jgi:O-antigen/teichoic acid export membrane protein
LSLRKQTFSAVRWTSAGTLFKTFLQIAQVAVLARLLAPEDYGLMAMVAVVLSFASLFSDFGVNSAFVQRRDVSDSQRSSLFWFNVIVSFCLMTLVVAMSPPLALFFGYERLTPLMMLSATTFVISALGIQVRMAAEKKLLFRNVMLIEVTSALIGFSVALWGAWHGWGVYALIAAAITGATTSTIFLWLFLSKGWRPALHLRFKEVQSFLGFGSALVANNLVNQVNLTIDMLLGGRMLAATQLGYYSVPRDLMLRVQSVVNPIITRVAFPLIAEVQKDTDRVRSIYLQTLNMTASTNAPIYMGVAFFAHEVVEILLGSGWEQSANILQILALWCGLRSTGNPVGSLLLGMGKASLALKWNLGLLLVVPPAIWLGAQYGPVGMAYALLIVNALLFVPGWFILVRPVCHARLGEYSVVALRPLLLSILAILPGWYVASIVDMTLARISIGVLVSMPFYLGLSYFFNRKWLAAMLELAGRRAVAG